MIQGFRFCSHRKKFFVIFALMVNYRRYTLKKLFF